MARGEQGKIYRGNCNFKSELAMVFNTWYWDKWISTYNLDFNLYLLLSTNIKSKGS